jgi:lambda family phage minor tail protein L
MAHDIPDIWAEKSRQLEDEIPWIWLYEFEVPTNPKTRYRLTNYDRSVVFGTSDAGVALTYMPFPIIHGELQESGDGDLPQIQVTVGYASLEMKAVLDEYDGLVGSPVVIRLVNLEALDDIGNQLRFDGNVVACKIPAGADRIAFTVASRNLIQQKIPGRRYIRNHCRFAYGGPECGYDLSNPTLLAAHATCSKTIEGASGCEAHGDAEVAASLDRKHPKRFGGWPSIPRRAQRVGF